MSGTRVGCRSGDRTPSGSPFLIRTPPVRAPSARPVTLPLCQGTAPFTRTRGAWLHPVSQGSWQHPAGRPDEGGGASREAGLLGSVRLAGVSACALRPSLGHREASDGRGGGAVSPAAAHPPSRPQTSAPPPPPRLGPDAAGVHFPCSARALPHRLRGPGHSTPGGDRARPACVLVRPGLC